MELITLEWDGAIAVVTVNRPKALNALNPQAIAELIEAVGQIDAKPEARAVIVTGSRCCSRTWAGPSSRAKTRTRGAGRSRSGAR